MNILKQGLCLALLGAGLAAAPVTIATEASATPTPSAATTPDQRLVQGMRNTARGAVTTSARAATGELGFARAAAGGDLLPGVEGDSPEAAGAKADAYLAKYGGAFGAGQGQLTRQRTDADLAGGYSVTYTQSYQGVPVFGAVLKAHVDSRGALTSVNGYAAPDLDLSVDPRLSAADAAARATRLVKTSPAMARNGGTAKASDLRVVANTLMVYRTGVVKGESGTNTLAYVAEVTDRKAVREMVFIDANSGKVLNRYSMIDNDIPDPDRELHEESPDSTPIWEEGDPFPDGLNEEQQNLILTSGESYWFFMNAFERDSYDGRDGRRITVNNDPTIQCPNANWNGRTTNYCTGVTSDDVVAHEWGHAYTEFTSGLIYQWQSGALNESYSDVWGETLDLINNREDEGEGDLDEKRPVGLCSSHTPLLPLVTINSPADIARNCVTGGYLGPDTFAPITKDVVYAQDVDEDGDGTASTSTDGCTAPFLNAAAVAGKIVVIDRGVCTFVVKAQNAKAAGAAAVIIGNRDDAPVGFSDPDTTLPPTVSIGLGDREAIKTALAAGKTVNATVQDAGGERFDSYRWLQSEESTAFGGAIRDMWNPTCLGDPGKVSDVEYKCSTDDQGGVHSNSGVTNHAYSLLVDGGTYNGVTVRGIGLTKAAHLWWQAQTNYLIPVSNFVDFADSLDKSCMDLTGKQLTELSVEPNVREVYKQRITADDCAQVAAVERAVELRKDPVQCDFGPLLDPNTPNPCGAGTGSVASYSQDFEGDISDWTAVPEGDIVYEGGIDEPWRFTRELPQGNLPPGDTRAAFGPTPDKGVCNGGAGDFSSANYLEGPPITVGTAGDIADTARLSFDHNIETEIGYDGGTVQISTDDGDTWTTVPASAYLFNGPTTLASEAEDSTNPLAGQPGFTGTDGGKTDSDWGTSIIDLSDDALGVANGDTIRVRFAIGRDGCGGVVGWFVDNVVVSTCKALAPATVTATHVPEPSTFGSASAVTVTVAGGAGTATGSVTVKEGGTTLGSATLTNGAASVPLPATLGAGAHALTVSYGGSNTYDAATKAVTATVNKAASTTTAAAVPPKVKKGKPFDAVVTVAAPGGSPTGTVEIYKGSKLLGTGTLSAGKATISITKKLAKKLKQGKNTLTAKYLGSANVAPSQADFVVKVKAKKKH